MLTARVEFNSKRFIIDKKSGERKEYSIDVFCEPSSDFSSIQENDSLTYDGREYLIAQIPNYQTRKVLRCT